MEKKKTAKPRKSPPGTDADVIRKANELRPLIPKSGAQGSTGQTSKHDR